MILSRWKGLSRPVRVIVTLTIAIWIVAVALMLTATPKLLKP